MIPAIGAALVAIGGALVLAHLRRRFVWVTVRGHSMSPTLADGQRLLVRRRDGAGCRRGDIVVFLVPDGHPQGLEGLWHLVKRVAALPGDPVPDWARDALGDRPVPAGRVVVAGDNARSIDSRALGFVDMRTIVGIVTAV